jgi:hypothetical protein
MTFDSPTSERRLTNAARLIRHGMWLLFLIAAVLMIIVRGSVPARTGSIWTLGCAVLALVLSFALRDVVRKVGHRNTEDRIVRDVKTFLERQPTPQPALAKPKLSQTSLPAADPFVPSRTADFVPLKGSVAYRPSAANPVVFDAFPLRRSVSVKMDFFAVFPPVRPNC